MARAILVFVDMGKSPFSFNQPVFHFEPSGLFSARPPLCGAANDPQVGRAGNTRHSQRLARVHESRELIVIAGFGAAQDRRRPASLSRSISGT
jgi:hypothetical protein